MTEGAQDTRDAFEGKPVSPSYPRSLRRAVEQGRWERASWLETRHSDRWLLWLASWWRPGRTAAPIRRGEYTL